MEDWFRGSIWFLLGIGLTLATDGFGTFGDDAPAESNGGTEQPATDMREPGPVAATKSSASAEDGAGSEELKRMQAQMFELERLLQARREMEASGKGTGAQGDLDELQARQNAIFPGKPGERSQREMEIDRVAEERALDRVKTIRSDIQLKEQERERRLQEIMDANR